MRDQRSVSCIKNTGVWVYGIEFILPFERQEIKATFDH